MNSETDSFQVGFGGDSEAGRSESSLSSGGAERPIRRPLNLARPWKFPAAHADAFLSRKHLRSDVRVPVDISLSREDGSFYDKGTGVVRDLSYSGLCLSDVSLENGRLLAASFEVELRPSQESPGRGSIRGRILRTYSSGMPAFGIEFLTPGSGAEERFRQGR